MDTLPTVSPICDAAQIPSIAGVEAKGPEETQFSMDFLIGSGNQVKSYLTFAAASVPLIENDMRLTHLIKKAEVNENLRILRVMSYQNEWIIVNYTNTSSTNSAVFGSGSEIKTSAV